VLRRRGFEAWKKQRKKEREKRKKVILVGRSEQDM
jgi:hypothetical protein